MTLQNRGKLSEFFRKNISFLAFVILFFAFSVTVPDKFLTSSNLLTFLGSSMDVLVVAMGGTFIILLGSIDLSAGSMVALCGVIAAKLFVSTGNLFVSVAVTCLFSCAVYALQGTLHAFLKVPTFIVTLAFLSIARACATLLSGGVNTSVPYSSPFKTIFGLRPWTLFIGFGIFFFCLFLEKYTVFGRFTKLTGGDEVVAQLSGLNVNKIKIMVYAFAGVMTGLGACLMAGRIGSGSPSIGDGYELTIISSVVLGGTSQRGGVGSVVGTLVGCVTLKLLANGLVIWGMSSEVQKLITGAILILAVFVSQERRKNMIVK